MLHHCVSSLIPFPDFVENLFKLKTMNTGPTLRKNPLGNMPDRSKYSGDQSDAACF